MKGARRRLRSLFCCSWRALQEGTQLAWSEDADGIIGLAAATLNGQKLVSVEVDPDKGSSIFTFDLGGSLVTWPDGDDPVTEQWMILKGIEAFAYRADGKYTCGPSTTPPDQERWLPLRS
jgi:hypothetical protein